MLIVAVVDSLGDGGAWDDPATPADESRGSRPR
jgi:hypothetical protein